MNKFRLYALAFVVALILGATGCLPPPEGGGDAEATATAQANATATQVVNATATSVAQADLCRNIDGVQTTVPPGMVRNPSNGECFVPSAPTPAPPPPAPPVPTVGPSAPAQPTPIPSGPMPTMAPPPPGFTGGDGACRLDKIGTWSEVQGAGNQRIEVGAHDVQHVDYYPARGVKSVSYIVNSIRPQDVPAVWFGYGSIWQGNAGPCASWDWVRDATEYAQARLDSGHSGIVVDLRGGQTRVVANVTNLSQPQVDSILGQHRAGRTVQTSGSPAPAFTPVAAAPPPGGQGGGGGTCQGEKVTSGIPIPPGNWQVGDDTKWWLGRVWSNASPQKEKQKERTLLLKPGEKYTLSPASGSAWTYTCEATALADFGKHPKDEEATIASLSGLTGVTMTRR